MPNSPHLVRLAQRIKLDRVPLSDRGSRLLVYQDRQRPHSLYIKLAERLTSLVPGLSAYRARPPYIPQLRLVDGEGKPLEYELTTYPHALVFHTVLGEFILAFQDDQTVTIGLPAEVAAGISFTVTPDLARPDGTGGEFKTVRNCAYSTNGAILLNSVEQRGVGYTVTLVAQGDADTAIALHIQPGLALSRAVRPFRSVLAEAENRWHRWFAAAPAVPEPYVDQYLYAWWVMGNNILAPHGYFRRPCVAPSKAHYVGAWQWDNYFHALALRHTDPQLAADQIRFMLDHQLPDGMIPDAVYDEGTITHLEIPVAAAVTKPPIIAWSALHVYERSGDVAMLREIYDPLVRWNSWWFGMNDDDQDGVVQYSHPFSSGLDDSPLWDGGVPVEAVDLNTYLVLQMEALGQIAQVLGRKQDQRMWLARADALATRMIDHFYDKRAGLFWSQHDHKPIRTLTPFSLYPLWTGRMPQPIVEKLVSHLHNPNTFWLEHPLPTVAQTDPSFDPQQMWRGPTWININYIFVEALQRAGRHSEAATLTERTMQLVMGQNDIYEYYNPLTGEPPPRAAPMFGWSAACFIDLAVRVGEGTLG